MYDTRTSKAVRWLLVFAFAITSTFVLAGYGGDERGALSPLSTSVTADQETLLALTTPSEVRSFIIDKSRELGSAKALQQWLEAVGFVTVLHVFPERHFRAKQQEISAYWSTGRNNRKSPFGGIYFHLRDFLPTAGVTLHVNFGIEAFATDVKLSFPLE